MSLSISLRRYPAWLINGITVTMGLALVQCLTAFVTGTYAAQIAIAAAVCTSLSDAVAAPRRLARRVVATAIASILAATLFLTIRPYDRLVVPGTVLIIFAAMLLLAWGPKAGTVSFGAILSLVFSMSLPKAETASWERLIWGICGTAGYAVWAVANACLLQAIWRKDALANTAFQEAALLAAIAHCMRSPGATLDSSSIFEREAILAETIQNAEDLIFANAKAPRVALDTAILLHLIDLRDLAMASNLLSGTLALQSGTQREVLLKADAIEAMSIALRAIAAYLSGNSASVLDEGAERTIAEISGELDRDKSSLLCRKITLLRELQRLFEPHARVSAICLHADMRRYVSPDEWRLASVVSNLHPDTDVFRHALRTSITAGLAYAIARHMPFLSHHPQWVVLTIAAVMQGSLAQTLARRNARVLGTLAGCVVAAGLTTIPSPTLLIACFLIASGVAHAFLGVRYSVTAAAAAVMAVLQASLTTPGSEFSAIERFVDTLVGAILGWAATYALPIWERRAMPALLQRATTAMRAYAEQTLTLDPRDAMSPRFARQQAYNAIRALSAIRDRSRAEPPDVRVPMSQLASWLTAAYGLMAGLSTIRLALTLNSSRPDDNGFNASMGQLLLQIDALLNENHVIGNTQSSLDTKSVQNLSSVAHLVPRIQHLLENASTLGSQEAEIRQYFSDTRSAADSLAKIKDQDSRDSHHTSCVGK